MSTAGPDPAAATPPAAVLQQAAPTRQVPSAPRAPSANPAFRDGRLVWDVGGLRVRLFVAADSAVAVVGIGPVGTGPAGTGPAGTGPAGPHTGTAGPAERATPLVELDLDSAGRTVSSPAAQRRRFAAGRRLRLSGHETVSLPGGVQLRVRQQDPLTGLSVESVFTHLDGADVLTLATELTAGPTPVRVRHVSSLSLTGFVPPGASAFGGRLVLHRADNAWAAEYRWRTIGLADAGLVDISGTGHAYPGSHASFDVTGAGSWSSGNHLPTGAVTDTATGTAWVWQVEHNGAWQWQAGDAAGDLWLTATGPSELAHQWTRVLGPGERFASVGVSLAVSAGGLVGGLRELTRHRRAVRRPNADDEHLPVIFNDYMNCLDGDPSTAAELPLVAAAAAAGAEYFVVDAGWYADDAGWWASVGDWVESAVRFPGGLVEVFDAVRAAGMIPGLWVEPEVVGVTSAAARELPGDAFFARDGVRLTENRRHHLDFRNTLVRERMDAVVDRLVGDLGVGYLKFDYNICILPGTDVRADSPGDGLLGHNRAYLDWLDGLFVRHPDLVVENCSSGGMRVDQALLARLSLQSTSDQQDPLRYAPIAAAAPSAMTPEQAATWAYPQPHWSPAVNDVTLVNPLLGRVHLSGPLDRLSPAQSARVAEAVTAHKAIRTRIPGALPSWPLGLPGWEDDHLALALDDGDGVLLSVWRRGGTAQIEVPLPALTGRSVGTRIAFGTPGAAARWSPVGVLGVTLDQVPGAVLVVLTPG